MSEPINHASQVGKRFLPKAATGPASARFTITKHIPQFDFGPRGGGVHPAFISVREHHGAETVHKADQFLAAYDPAPPNEAAA